MAILKNIPKLRSKPMRDLIYEHLRKAVILGDLKPGATFTDAEIAAEYGVSRTPVREAVQKLEAEGYIERVPMRGNRVSSVSPYELANTFAIRKALETLAVRYSALRISDAALDEIEALLSRADAVFSEFSGDEMLERFFPIVKEYNKIVFEGCGSKRLTDLVFAQREIFDRYMVMRTILPNRPEKSLSRRKALYLALRGRDPERAAEIWTEHLNESFVIWREKSGNADKLSDFPFF